MYPILPTYNSSKYFQLNIFVSWWTGGKLPYFNWDLILQIRLQNLKLYRPIMLFVKLNISFSYNYSKTYQNCNRCKTVYTIEQLAYV